MQYFFANINNVDTEARLYVGKLGGRGRCKIQGIYRVIIAILGKKTLDTFKEAFEEQTETSDDSRALVV